MLPRALRRVAAALVIGLALAVSLALGFVPFVFDLSERGVPMPNDPGAVNLISLVGNGILLAILLSADRARRMNRRD
jgi:hypothetical protein